MRLHIIGGVLAIALPTVTLAQSAAPPAAQYMMMAGQSDQFEIQSGEVAETKAANLDLRKFGRQMVADHTKTSALVMDAAKKSGFPPSPPPPLTANQEAMLAELQGLSGAAFDKAYSGQQMKAHEDALAMQRAYAANGDDPNLKAAAIHIVPIVQLHWTMLQNTR
jgi:putative membrane protein